MSKWQDKPTPKQRQYAVLITLIATIAFVLILYLMSLATQVFIPFSLLFGVSFMFFVPVACYIGVSKYRENVYSATGVYSCLLIVIVFIIVVVGINLSRPP